MEHNDDPEKRIAELERRQGRATAGRPVERPRAYPSAPQPSRHAASRRFWAQSSSPAPSTSAPGQKKGVNRYVVYGLAAVGVLAGALIILVIAWDFGALGSGVPPAFAGLGRVLVGVVVLGGAFGVVGYFSLKTTLKAYPQRRTTVIGVTSDVLTVDERPGMAYPLRGATLGTWGMAGGISVGTALHLQSGTHRFVLGGRDYRPDYGTRLDAANVGGQDADVDAWVSASDFGEILAIAGLRHRQDARPPAPGSPIRCLLYRNPFLFQKDGFMAQYRVQDYVESSSQPVVAIDVGTEAIWLTDPQNNALIASSWRTQATAIPTTYEPSFGSLYAGQSRGFSIAPQMVVSGPSLPPLSIACLEAVDLRRQSRAVWWPGASVRRFAWHGASVVREPADYSVSAADWLTLVGTFGLNEYLADDEPPPGQPPASSAPRMYPAPAETRGTNQMAISTLIVLLVFPIGAIVCGHIALSQIKKTGEKGWGLAVAGMAIGYAATGSLLVLLLARFLAP
jgi:hypothetical protein